MIHISSDIANYLYSLWTFALSIFFGIGSKNYLSKVANGIHPMTDKKYCFLDCVFALHLTSLKVESLNVLTVNIVVNIENKGLKLKLKGVNIILFFQTVHPSPRSLR